MTASCSLTDVSCARAGLFNSSPSRDRAIKACDKNRAVLRDSATYPPHKYKSTQHPRRPRDLDALNDLAPTRACRSGLAPSFWNTVYLERPFRLSQTVARRSLRPCSPDLRPLGRGHIILTGDYVWRQKGS